MRKWVVKYSDGEIGVFFGDHAELCDGYFKIFIRQSIVAGVKDPLWFRIDGRKERDDKE